MCLRHFLHKTVNPSDIPGVTRPRGRVVSAWCKQQLIKESSTKWSVRFG